MLLQRKTPHITHTGLEQIGHDMLIWAALIALIIAVGVATEYWINKR